MTSMTPALDEANASESHDPDELEAQRLGDFSRNHSHPDYRPMQQLCLRWYAEANRLYYDHQLKPTRFGLSKTHPRTVARYEPVNGYGARGEMVISDGFALARNRDWVVRGYPSLGFGLALRDLVLRLAVQKACLELPRLVAQVEKQSLVAVQTAEANRIGLDEGLAAVRDRHRTDDDEDTPLLAGWPFTARDQDYYRGDVTPKFLSLVGGGARPGPRQPQPEDSLYRYFLLLLLTGRQDRLQEIFQRQIERAEEKRRRGFPRLARVERGQTDIDGVTPLSATDTEIDPNWLRKDHYLVAQVVQGIAGEKEFDHLPVLADALEDAGCGNPYLLRHLRARMEHTSACWALNALLAAAKQVTTISE